MKIKKQTVERKEINVVFRIELMLRKEKHRKSSISHVFLSLNFRLLWSLNGVSEKKTVLAIFLITFFFVASNEMIQKFQVMMIIFGRSKVAIIRFKAKNSYPAMTIKKSSLFQVSDR